MWANAITSPVRQNLKLIKEEKFAEAIEIAISQVENGAQVIDVNMDEALLDSKNV